MIVLMTSSSESHSLPLIGRKILVTRTEEGNKRERQKLESLGADVIELSTIAIHPPTSWNEIDAAIHDIEEFDWILFTSPNGVRAFFQRLHQVSGNKKLDTNFACVGPATKAELELHGYLPAFVPSEYLTEKLGDQLSGNFLLDGKRILLARAEVASKGIREALEKSGAFVTEAAVYRTLPKKGIDGEDILDGVTDITMTSPSTVEGLLTCVDSKEIKSRQIRVHCIGPVTARKAEERGLHVDSIANVHTIEGLVMDLVGSQKKENKAES